MKIPTFFFLLRQQTYFRLTGSRYMHTCFGWRGKLFKLFTFQREKERERDTKHLIENIPTSKCAFFSIKIDETIHFHRCLAMFFLLLAKHFKSSLIAFKETKKNMYRFISKRIELFNGWLFANYMLCTLNKGWKKEKKNNIEEKSKLPLSECDHRPTDSQEENASKY